MTFDFVIDDELDAELERRWADHEAHPEKACTWDEVVEYARSSEPIEETREEMMKRLTDKLIRERADVYRRLAASQ